MWSRLVLWQGPHGLCEPRRCRDLTCVAEHHRKLYCRPALQSELHLAQRRAAAADKTFNGFAQRRACVFTSHQLSGGKMTGKKRDKCLPSLVFEYLLTSCWCTAGEQASLSLFKGGFVSCLVKEHEVASVEQEPSYR